MLGRSLQEKSLGQVCPMPPPISLQGILEGGASNVLLCRSVMPLCILHYPCYHPGHQVNAPLALLALLQMCAISGEPHTPCCLLLSSCFAKLGFGESQCSLLKMFKDCCHWTGCPAAAFSPKRSFSLSPVSMTGVIFPCCQIIENNNLFSKNRGAWKKCLCIS